MIAVEITDDFGSLAHGHPTLGPAVFCDQFMISPQWFWNTDAVTS